MRSAHRKASGPVVGQLDGQAAGELDHGALAGGVPRPGGSAGQAERARLERTQPFSQRLLRALVVSPEPSYIDSEYQLRQPRAKEQIGGDLGVCAADRDQCRHTLPGEVSPPGP